MCKIVDSIRHPIEKLKKKLWDRFFYAVFQSTRVTNDAYGWRPTDKK